MFLFPILRCWGKPYSRPCIVITCVIVVVVAAVVHTSLLSICLFLSVCEKYYFFQLFFCTNCSLWAADVALFILVCFLDRSYICWHQNVLFKEAIRTMTMRWSWFFSCLKLSLKPMCSFSQSKWFHGFTSQYFDCICQATKNKLFLFFFFYVLNLSVFFEMVGVSQCLCTNATNRV